MNNFNNQLATFANGSKEAAYAMFKADETVNSTIDFLQFCTYFESVIASRKEESEVVMSDAYYS